MYDEIGLGIDPSKREKERERERERRRERESVKGRSERILEGCEGSVTQQ